MGNIPLFGQNCRQRSARTNQLSALFWLQFDIVDGGPFRDIFQRKMVPYLHFRPFPAHHTLAHLQAVRGQDVGFFPVLILDQGNACAPVGVIFDRLDLGRRLVTKTLEIKDP